MAILMVTSVLWGMLELAHLGFVYLFPHNIKIRKNQFQDIRIRKHFILNEMQEREIQKIIADQDQLGNGMNDRGALDQCTYLREDRLIESENPKLKRYHHRTYCKENMKPIVDLNYDVNQFQIREPMSSPAKGQDRFLVFVGCSFVFGEGVQNNETLMSQFARLNHSYRVYSNGLRGGAPNLHLKNFQGPESDAYSLITEKSGVFVISVCASSSGKSFVPGGVFYRGRLLDAVASIL